MCVCACVAAGSQHGYSEIPCQTCDFWHGSFNILHTCMCRYVNMYIHAYKQAHKYIYSAMIQFDCMLQLYHVSKINKNHTMLSTIIHYINDISLRNFYVQYNIFLIYGPKK